MIVYMYLCSQLHKYIYIYMYTHLLSNQWIDAVNRFTNTMVWYVALKFAIVYEIIILA